MQVSERGEYLGHFFVECQIIEPGTLIGAPQPKLQQSHLLQRVDPMHRLLERAMHVEPLKQGQRLLYDTELVSQA